MCGKPRPKGFRTVAHSDTICRILFGPEIACFRRRSPPHGNHLFSVIAIEVPIVGRHSILGSFFGGGRRPVLVPSPYAYQKASWLVPAISRWQTLGTCSQATVSLDAGDLSDWRR